MPIKLDVDFYPKDDTESFLGRVIFKKNIENGYFFLVHGVEKGGQKAAEYTSEKLEIHLKSEKMQTLIKNKNKESPINFERNLYNEIYRLIYLLNYQLLEYKDLEQNVSLRSAVVALELVVIANEWAFLVHLGHNGIASLANLKIDHQTKPQDQFSLDKKSLAMINDPKIKSIVKNIDVSKNIPTSALGKIYIAPFTVDLVPLNEDKIFFIYTQKFNEFYGLRQGDPIKIDLLTLLKQRKSATDIAKNLYEYSYRIKKDTEVGILAISCFVDSNDTRSKEISIIVKEILTLDVFKDVRLNQKMIYKMASLFELVKFGNHDEFIQQGLPSEKMFILLAGAATICINSKELFTITRGDPIGDVSILDSDTHHTTAKATTNIEAICMTKKNFLNLKEKDKDLYERFKNGLHLSAGKKLVSTLNELQFLKSTKN